MAIVPNKDGIGGSDPRLATPRGSQNSFVITPSDSVDFVIEPREIVCGGAGNVAVVKNDGSVTNYTVVAGQTIVQVCRRVNATGTTATPLVGTV